MESVIFYFTIFALSTWLLTKSKVGQIKRIDIPFVIAILLPILMAALRKGVGADYDNYIYIFQNNVNQSFGEWFVSSRSFGGTRIGVFFMAKIAGIFNSSEVFLGIFATITVFPVAWRLKTEYSSSVYGLSYFIFLTTLYCSGLNICKQIAAIGLLFFGLKYVNERKFIKYVIIVLLASSIHVTAMCAIAIYFLYDPQKTFLSFKKMCYVLLGVLGVSLLPYVLRAVGGRFEGYLDYEKDISNLSFYITLAWCLLFCVMYKRFMMLDKRNSVLIMMMVIGSLLNLSGFYSPFVKRIALYFTFSQFLLMGQLPDMLTNGRSRIFVRSCIVIYTIALFVITYYILGQSDIIPYKLIGGAA